VLVLGPTPCWFQDQRVVGSRTSGNPARTDARHHVCKMLGHSIEQTCTDNTKRRAQLAKTTPLSDWPNACLLYCCCCCSAQLQVAGIHCAPRCTVLLHRTNACRRPSLRSTMHRVAPSHKCKLQGSTALRAARCLEQKCKLQGFTVQLQRTMQAPGLHGAAFR